MSGDHGDDNDEIPDDEISRLTWEAFQDSIAERLGEEPIGISDDFDDDAEEP